MQGSMGRILKSGQTVLAEMSELIDETWYLNTYPDVAQAKVPAAQHFMTIGWAEGRNPNPWFDTEWYFAQYPDVELSGQNPLTHYVEFGWKEGRNPHPNFSTNAYLSSNPEVRNSALTPLGHFLKSHRSEGATHPPISPVSAGSSAKQHDLSPAHSSPAETLHRPLRSDDEIIAAEFDHEFYLRRYQDIAQAKIDPVQHYIKHGARELRAPRPDFDPKYYVEKNDGVPAVKNNPFLHYLKTGRAEGRPGSALSAGDEDFDKLAAIMNAEPRRLQAIISEKKNSIRQRLMSGELGQMVAKAGELDPLIRHAWLAALNPGISPVRSAQQNRQIAAMYKLQEAALWKRAKVAVLIPWVHVSGATRIAGHLATALAKIFGSDEVVIIRTETSELQFPEWFPEGSRHIDFAAEAKGLDSAGRERLLVEYLRSLRLEHIFNVNSRTFWNALEHFGLALSKSTKLHTYMFCNEKNIYGDWVGYPVRNYHKFADIHDTMICDSQFLANELKGRFLASGEEAAKLVVFDTPMNSEMQAVPQVQRPAGQRPRVYWAGRFDRQKRLDVAFAIARKMPDVDFHYWGKPTLDREFNKLKKPENVILEGVYQRFEDLPLNRCDAWLYTAEWDGVPNILVEVAAAGIPLVGSIAGGTGEVLVKGLCERIEDIENVDQYVTSLRWVFNNRTDAKNRALKLRDLIVTTRSEQAYLGRLKAALDRQGANR